MVDAVNMYHQAAIALFWWRDGREVLVSVTAFPDSGAIAPQADDVMRVMQQNHEVLILGLIPGELRVPAKAGS